MSTPYSTPPSLLGALIKEARDRRDLTQAELAAELGVSVRTLQNWEGGKTPRAEQRRHLRRWLSDSDDYQQEATA